MLSFFLLCFLFLAELAASYYDIEKHRTYYNDTDYDSLDADLCADHVQSIFQCLPYSCTCKRSKQKSGAAKRGYAADNASCYTVHFVHVSCFHVTHACLCAEDQSDDTGADRADQIRLGRRHDYVYTGELRCIDIGTDRVNVTPGACL